MVWEGGGGHWRGLLEWEEGRGVRRRKQFLLKINPNFLRESGREQLENVFEILQDLEMFLLVDKCDSLLKNKV